MFSLGPPLPFALVTFPRTTQPSLIFSAILSSAPINFPRVLFLVSLRRVRVGNWMLSVRRKAKRFVQSCRHMPRTTYLRPVGWWEMWSSLQDINKTLLLDNKRSNICKKSTFSYCLSLPLRVKAFTCRTFSLFDLWYKLIRFWLLRFPFFKLRQL